MGGDGSRLMMVAGSVTSCRVCCRYMRKRKTRQKPSAERKEEKKKRFFRADKFPCYFFFPLSSIFFSVCVCVFGFFFLSLFSLLLPGENERGRSSHTRQSRSSSPPRDKSRAHLDSFFFFLLFELFPFFLFPLYLLYYIPRWYLPAYLGSQPISVCVCVLVGCD